MQRKGTKKITKEYIEYYNNVRPHESLNYKTPSEYYYEHFRELEEVI
jgi:putative transposase